MTTSHKPTFHPAVGNASQGGFRYHAPRVQFSARDIAHHTKLKVRQAGQHAPEEVGARDLKAELLQRETQHKQKQLADKAKAGLLPYANVDTPLLEAPEGAAAAKAERPAAAAAAAVAEAESAAASASAPAAAAAAAAAAASTSGPKVDLSQFDDADDEDDDDAGAGADGDGADAAEDDEAELLRELEKIKAEREAERQRKRAEEEADLKKTEDEAALSGNPLLAAAAAARAGASGSGSFGVKRRWDDDVVFRNQAKDERKPKKRFINDTIRSDFHRNFLNKYVK